MASHIVGEWTPRHQKILNDWANRVLANIYADPERRAKFEVYMEKEIASGHIRLPRNTEHRENVLRDV